MNNLVRPNGTRYKVNPATEHPFRAAKAGLCLDCGGNLDMRGHVLARRKAAGKPPEGLNGPAFPPCFKCGGVANQWFDGPAATNRRPICAACEYADWKATASSYNEVEIG